MALSSAPSTPHIIETRPVGKRRRPRINAGTLGEKIADLSARRHREVVVVLLCGILRGRVMTHALMDNLLLPIDKQADLRLSAEILHKIDHGEITTVEQFCETIPAGYLPTLPALGISTLKTTIQVLQHHTNGAANTLPLTQLVEKFDEMVSAAAGRRKVAPEVTRENYIEAFKLVVRR